MKRDQIPDQNFEKKVIFGKMIQNIFSSQNEMHYFKFFTRLNKF